MPYPTITGVGLAVPERLLTNQDLIDETGLTRATDAGMRRATGIEQRYWIDEPGEHATQLGLEAGRAALAMAGVLPKQLDGIHLSTGSPDLVSPSVASLVHGELGAPEDCGAVDINAACAGGVYALKHASMEMMGDAKERTLVIGSEIISHGLDRTDHRTVFLFGDGAGAAVLEQQEGANRPYFASITRADRDAIYVPAAGHAKTDPDQASHIRMNGAAVRNHAAHVMPTAAYKVAEQAGMAKDGRIDWDDIDFFIPHQANRRMVEALGDGLGVPEDKRIVSVDRYGNTSSASILMAMRDAYDRGIIPSGRKRVLFTAVGAGMVGGAALIDVNLPEKS